MCSGKFAAESRVHAEQSSLVEPHSIINEVHTSLLGRAYDAVARYLSDTSPRGRRPYAPFLGTVYELDACDRTITFQCE